MKTKKRKTKKNNLKAKAKKQEQKETTDKLEPAELKNEPETKQEVPNQELIKEAETKKPIDYSKQTKAVVIFMIVVLASIGGIYYLVQKGKVTEFKGIEFQKTNEGNLVFYKSLMGYVTSYGEEIKFVLKLRIDPKKLEKIPADADVIILKNATITMSSAVLNCPKIHISTMDLAMTLKAFGTHSIGATTDKDYANEKNVTFADCRDATGKTVIVFKEGNETRIYQDREYKNCYIIEAKDCEVREGYERFLLEYLQDSYMRNQ